MPIDLQKYALQIAEKLREIALRDGNVPVKSGDLRKAHVSEPHGTTDAILSANTPYARAVHDGRPAITIKPKKAKRLVWRADGKRGKPDRGAAFVNQPARQGNPWLARAVEEMEREGLGFLAPELGEDIAAELSEGLRKRGLSVKGR